MGGILFLLAFKKNLLEKDLKLWHIVMETPERNICILLEVKVKRMKLELYSFNTSQQVGK